MSGRISLARLPIARHPVSTWLPTAPASIHLLTGDAKHAGVKIIFPFPAGGIRVSGVGNLSSVMPQTYFSRSPDDHMEKRPLKAPNTLSYTETSREFAGDYRLHYHEAGDGPPLLLLHGSGPGVSGWSNFSENIPVFAENFRTLCLDMPGFGASPSVAWRRIYSQVAADAVRSFVDHMQIDKIDIIGNSMGGNVATEFALAHPDRVRRLVLMGPGGLAVNTLSPPVSEGARRLFEFLGDPRRERMVAWVETMVSDPALVTDTLIDERMANALKPNVIATTAGIFATFADPELDTSPPLWARVKNLQHQTLVIWGRDDRMLPFEGGLFPFRQLPNAELHVFSNCGHWAQIERKDEFERVVLEFLRRP
jgi:4,5:9,10-diseco-3-hydroxy-5,9,17-trioxoandrosta-1(10),2-diene-4-oate hydrolase